MMDVFGEDAKRALACAYPDAPALLTHGLRDHPLLGLPRLVEAANALPPGDIEHNLGDIAVSQPDPASVPSNGLDPAQTVARIADNRSWIALRNVERLPEYAALTRAILAELEPVLAPATGPAHRHEAYVFVTSPGSVTPFHMDPEHNVLLQLRGTKTMTVFPGDDPRVVPDARHEAFAAGGHCNLDYDEGAMAPLGRAFTLRAGDALHVPLLAPHFVRNGSEVSVSLSITWRSEASDRRRRIHLANRRLRRFGLDPRALGRSRAADAAKAALGRFA